MTFKRRLLKVLLTCLLFASNSWAVTQTFSKQWSLMTLTGNYGNVLYMVEPQLRLIDANRPFNQFLINAASGLKLPLNFEIWGGQTMSTVAQDAVQGSKEEYRAWEQIVWSHDFIKFALTSRSRVEQRRSLDFPHWAYRVRERVMLNIPIASNLSAVIFDEFFYSLNHVAWISTRTFDQNRLYLGVEQALSKETFFGVGYLSQYLTTIPQQMDNVFMLTYRVNLQT